MGSLENITKLHSTSKISFLNMIDLHAAAASLPYNTLLIIILVPVLSVGILTITFVMFCFYWRRRKYKNGISEGKLKEKLDKFNQRKIESQRELSISTISSMVGDGSEDFRSDTSCNKN